MSKNRRKHRQTRAGQRRFRVRGDHRVPVDLGKFSKALLGLAAAEAERQAQAEHAQRTSGDDDGGTSPRSTRQGGGTDADQ